MFAPTFHSFFAENDPLRPQGFKQYAPSLLISTLAINVLSLALPVMTLQIYDRILPNPASGTLPVLIIGVCIAITLELVLRLTRSYLIGRSGASYEHRMACQSLHHVLHADLSRMQVHGVGEHLHRMGSVSKLKEFYNGYALTTIAELFFLPIAIALIYYIAGVLVLVPILVITCFTLFSLAQGRHLRAALEKREKADDKRFNFLVETLEGVHTIKSFGLEKYFERRYEALEEGSSAANYHVTEETSNMFNGGAIFSHIMVASVITAGAWAVLQGYVTTGALIATLLLSGRMMQPVQKALSLWTRYQDYQLARQHVERLFAQAQHIRTTREHQREITKEGELRIENASFRFSLNGQALLQHISLELKRDEVVLITGEHGSGKTTLLNLIAGVYPLISGRILIDGEDVLSYESAELARHLGYIRVQPIIFRGTIRDNITAFGAIKEKQAREIAALLDVEQDIASLPAGFDTFLNGSDIDAISPGLKQRIAIVRALAPKPRVILFDNADRSLDKTGYQQMYHLLARLKGKAAMVIVSDDSNIRSLADRHYHLSEGRLKQVGNAAHPSRIMPYEELGI